MTRTPHPDDLKDFALEFTYAMISWNMAENSAKTILSLLLGGTQVSKAVTSDMKNRSILQGLESACREKENSEYQEAIAHFSNGFGIILGYRNQYVHNLKSIILDKPKDGTPRLGGLMIQLKSEGKLKIISKHVTTEDMSAFRETTTQLSTYGRAILQKIGVDRFDWEENKDQEQPLLDKPVWPVSIQNSPRYLQD